MKIINLNEGVRGQTSLKKLIYILAANYFPDRVDGMVNNYCVHHLDNNHENNNPENIGIMPKNNHSSLHRSKNPRTFEQLGGIRLTEIFNAMIEEAKNSVDGE